jgi:hypothetical protein
MPTNIDADFFSYLIIVSASLFPLHVALLTFLVAIINKNSKKQRDEYIDLLELFEEKTGELYVLLNVSIKDKSTLSNRYILQMIEIINMAEYWKLVDEENQERWNKLIVELYKIMQANNVHFQYENEFHKFKKEQLRLKIANLRQSA